MTLLKKELWYRPLCAFGFYFTLNLKHVVFSMSVYLRQDPFGDHLKGMMSMIHDFMPPTASAGLREKGTQEYENDVVDLHNTG